MVFNPNVWAGGDDELTRAALRAEDAGAQAHVGSLLEEVAQSPGIPDWRTALVFRLVRVSIPGQDAA